MLTKFLHETTCHVADRLLIILNQNWLGNLKKMGEHIFRSNTTVQQYNTGETLRRGNSHRAELEAPFHHLR